MSRRKYGISRPAILFGVSDIGAKFLPARALLPKTKEIMI